MNETVRRLVADQAMGDPWGEGMDVLFSVANVLYAEDPNMIPASWQFRQAPGRQSLSIEDYATDEDISESWTTTSLAQAFLAGEISEDELVHAGNVLSRYVDMLDAAGLSY